MLQMAIELFAMQAPLNDSRGVQSARDVGMYLERGNLSAARSLCFSEADKLGSYPEIKEFIKTKLFAGEKEHPWSIFG